MQPPKLITLEQANWLAINSPEHQGTGDSKCYNSWPASEQTPPRCNFQDKDLIPELHQQRRYLEDLTTHSDQRLPYAVLPSSCFRPCGKQAAARLSFKNCDIHRPNPWVNLPVGRRCMAKLQGRTGGQYDTRCIIWRALQWTNNSNYSNYASSFQVTSFVVVFQVMSYSGCDACRLFCGCFC